MSNIELEKQLEEAYALICMQERALIYAIDRFNSEISATAETVAEWRAKETEPLRREVAMLRDLLDRLFNLFENGAPCYEGDNDDPLYIGNAVRPDDLTYKLIVDALIITKATAEAYEREVRAKLSGELPEDYRSRVQGNVMERI